MSKAVNEKISPIVQALPLACADESAAADFLEDMRWGDAPVCPRCSCVDIRKMEDKDGNRSKRYLWMCTACKKQFTVRIGTVLEESRIALRHWCYGFWRVATSKKGVSALEIKRQTGISYKSALFMLHRIRFGMALTGDEAKLTGTVEADETYIGGKPRYKGQSKRGSGTNKQPVAVLVERGGNARAYTVSRVNALTLQAAIREHVTRDARIVTDENPVYTGLRTQFKAHSVVNHSRKEYVRGSAHTNSAESFNALVKRGLHGIYHSVSRKHLHRYLAEFVFRYNYRKVDDGARVAALVGAMVGKRLMYKEPVGDVG